LSLKGDRVPLPGVDRIRQLADAQFERGDPLLELDSL